MKEIPNLQHLPRADILWSGAQTSVARQGTTVAIYRSPAQAEDAIRELQRSGFNLRKLSIVGRDDPTETQVVGYYTTGDRIKYWGTLGAFWGGLWGFLFGSAFFWVPELGPLLVAGPLVTWIVAALQGAAITGGLSVLGAALYSIGVPRHSVLDYETAVKEGKLVVVAHGTPDEVAWAHRIIKTTAAMAIAEHQAVIATKQV
jgi:hypothetical protein